MNADLDTGRAVHADRMRRAHRRARRQLAARARGLADWCLYTRLGDILVGAWFTVFARRRREALHASAERSIRELREWFGPMAAAERRQWRPDPVAVERVRQILMALPTTPPRQPIRARVFRLLGRRGSVATDRSHA